MFDIKVWDVNNNLFLVWLEFIVVDNVQFFLDYVFNYLNLFIIYIMFFFEYNQLCFMFDVQVVIYIVVGRVVKMINKMVNMVGFCVDGIEWDGKDDFGDQLVKGVYVYKLSVKMLDGLNVEKVEKLVLLR